MNRTSFLVAAFFSLMTFLCVTGPARAVAFTVEFEGVGFVLLGRADKLGEEDYVFQAKVLVDGKEIETASWPTELNKSRFHLTWKFELDRGKHKIELQLLNPTDKAMVLLQNLVVYDNKPANTEY